MTRIADIDISSRDISDLTTVDAVAAFRTRVGYPTDCRAVEQRPAYGFTENTASAIRPMELALEDDEQFVRVLFVRLRLLTAKSRDEFAKNLGRCTTDYLLILTRNFDELGVVPVAKETTPGD